MTATPRTVIASAILAGAMGAVPALAAGPSAGRLSLVDGKPAFAPPKDWTLASQWDKDGRQYAEYRFPLQAAAGRQAVARLSLRLLARSVRYDDLPPDEARALEHASDEAIQDTMREVESMPDMEFEAGGSQLTYTALEDGKRYHYVQYINIKGVAQAGSALLPAVAVGLRCRSAVDESAPQSVAAADELESRCYDLMAGLGGTEGGTVSGGEGDPQ